MTTVADSIHAARVLANKAKSCVSLLAVPLADAGWASAYETACPNPADRQELARAVAELGDVEAELRQALITLGVDPWNPSIDPPRPEVRP